MAETKPRDATIDFARLLRQIRNLGYDVKQIAMRANLSETAIRNYVSGTMPLHPNGERIIAFWCSVTSQTRAECPTVREMPTVSRSRFLQKHITVR